MGGPDFKCKKDSQCFYAEVTCLTEEQVIRVSKSQAGAHYYRFLTESFRTELSNKTLQCSGLDGPCVVALCTLHVSSSVGCFGRRPAENLLTGTTSLAMRFDASQGRGVGDLCQITALKDSAFIRFSKTDHGKVECARNPISAVLLCGYGPCPPVIVGALHPNPNHPFDAALLPAIPFCRLRDGWESGQTTVEWIEGNE